MSGSESQVPISMQMGLNKRDGDKGRANAKHIRKPPTVGCKYVPTRSTHDLELGVKLPRVTYNSGEKTETEVQLFLGIANTFLRLPPGGRWCGKPGYASSSQSSPVDNINPDSKK